MSFWFLLAYLALQLAIGLWVSRGIRSESDYFLAGRRLGTSWVAFSLFATWFGAETCLGASGAIYEEGLSGGRADPLGYSLCLLFLGLVLAARLWRGGFMTLGDLYRRRYGVSVERLAVLVLVPSSLIWGAAQVRAFGQVVSTTMDVDVTFAIYLSAAFAVAYTFFGGILGDVVTDLVQGIILSASLLVMLGVAVWSLGGPGTAFASIEPERWSLFTPEESAWQQIDRWAIPVMGSLVAQELVARVVASKSERTARRAPLWACGIYLLVGSSPVLLGLLGPSLIPQLDDPEQLLPKLAQQLLPTFWFAVFSCALISAVLSSIDSILLASSALLSHNLLAPALKLTSERERLLCARWLVLVTGAVTLALALHADGVYELVETASAFGTAGVLVTTLIALFLPHGGRYAAVTALLTGLVATPIAEHVLDLPAPFLSSVLLSLLSYALVARFVREPRVELVSEPPEPLEEPLPSRAQP